MLAGMPDLSHRPVRMVFTSRVGGVSSSPYDSFNLGTHVGDDPADVAANRARLADVLGLPAERFVWMEQLHTNTVTVVEGPQRAPVEATEATLQSCRCGVIGLRDNPGDPEIRPLTRTYIRVSWRYVIGGGGRIHHIGGPITGVGRAALSSRP